MRLFIARIHNLHKISTITIQRLKTTVHPIKSWNLHEYVVKFFALIRTFVRTRFWLSRIEQLSQICYKVFAVCCINRAIVCIVLVPRRPHVRIIIDKDRTFNICHSMLRRSILYNVQFVNLRHVCSQPIPFSLANRFVVFLAAVLSRPANNANDEPKSNELVKHIRKRPHVNQRHRLNIGRNIAILQLVQPVANSIKVGDSSVHVKINCLCHWYPFQNLTD